MWNKIKCFFGFHEWSCQWTSGAKRVRLCRNCSKAQSTSYDMHTGEIYWVDGNYWFKQEVKG